MLLPLQLSPQISRVFQPRAAPLCALSLQDGHRHSLRRSATEGARWQRWLVARARDHVACSRVARQTLRVDAVGVVLRHDGAFRVASVDEEVASRVQRQRPATECLVRSGSGFSRFSRPSSGCGRRTTYPLRCVRPSVRHSKRRQVRRQGAHHRRGQLKLIAAVARVLCSHCQMEKARGGGRFIFVIVERVERGGDCWVRPAATSSHALRALCARLRCGCDTRSAQRRAPRSAVLQCIPRGLRALRCFRNSRSSLVDSARYARARLRCDAAPLPEPA